MGVITIKVPQDVNKTYRIASEAKARQLIDRLEGIETGKKRRDLGDVVGLWAERSQTAEEIARELRRGSNSKRSDG